MKSMKKRFIDAAAAVCAAIVLTASCAREEHPDLPAGGGSGTVFRLEKSAYDGASTRASGASGSGNETGRYDRLYHYIVDGRGYVVENLKSFYDPEAGVIRAEGLHEGDYELVVLGIDGDADLDGVEVHRIAHLSDGWIEFPESPDGPLNADYFYSRTPFTVQRVSTGGGYEEVADIPESIVQKRIICRLDFDFSFRSVYVRNSVVSETASLNAPVFYTTLSGGGDYSGATDGTSWTMDLGEAAGWKLMPIAEGAVLSGEIALETVNYLGERVSQSYSLSMDAMEPNTAYPVITEVIHPDDRLATMYVTEAAMSKGNLSYILQDDEPVSVYTDRTQRSFNTAEPLQVSVTDDGSLHIRFYSPVGLDGVLVRAMIPAVGDEYFDLAYFSHIPAFADFTEPLSLTLGSTMVLTGSGRYVEVDRLSAADLDGIVFSIECDDPYWQKLRQIEHGWTLYWGLFGGDPSKADGGPVGNWMGIRPVHCRESVAFFLNFTFMIDMPEHEEILRANAEKLYDDNGDPVKVEEVLAKMRRNQTLQVGLVYTGNGIIGLGSPSVFGAYQRGWFEHYFNRYACSVMFHELGHVMGYGHSSSFTYGPWAEELMNNFYVDNISRMPVDGTGWLDSANNPNRYE